MFGAGNILSFINFCSGYPLQVRTRTSLAGFPLLSCRPSTFYLFSSFPVEKIAEISLFPTQDKH